MSTVAVNPQVSRTLMVTAVLVALSSTLLFLMPGYATVLSQFLTLNAWGIVSGVMSQEFADTHRGPIWTIATILSLLAFLIPATAIWLVFRSRQSPAGIFAIIGWFVLYLGSLFFLFPASDGP